MSEETELKSPRVGRGRPAMSAAEKAEKAANKAAKTARAPVPVREPVRQAVDDSARFEQADDDAEVPRMTRRSRTVGGTDDFAIPAHLKKPGWDYEFKTSRVNGADVDGADFAFYNEQGWKNVLAKDMPGMLAPGSTAKYVERRGQIMMMRPQYLTDEAKAEDYKLAEQQKYDKLMSSSAVPIGDKRMTATAPEISIEGVAGTHTAAAKGAAA